MCVGGDGETAEAAGAAGDGAEGGDAFGADGEAVGGAFDVAAGVDAAVFILEGGADAEVGVGGAGRAGGRRERRRRVDPRRLELQAVEEGFKEAAQIGGRGAAGFEDLLVAEALLKSGGHIGDGGDG